MEVVEKISIEEFNKKECLLNVIETENKAILTHYFHNIHNGVTHHYEEKAIQILNDFEIREIA